MSNGKARNMHKTAFLSCQLKENPREIGTLPKNSNTTRKCCGMIIISLNLASCRFGNAVTERSNTGNTFRTGTLIMFV